MGASALAIMLFLHILFCRTMPPKRRGGQPPVWNFSPPDAPEPPKSKPNTRLHAKALKEDTTTVALRQKRSGLAEVIENMPYKSTAEAIEAWRSKNPSAFDTYELNYQNARSAKERGEVVWQMVDAAFGHRLYRFDSGGGAKRAAKA